MPVLAHRIRKAAVKGAKVAFLNPRRFDYMFPVAGYAASSDMVAELSALVHAAAGAANKPVPAGVGNATVTEVHKSLIAALSHGARHAVILGTLAQRHPAYAQLKALSAAIADLCGASVGCITEGPNAAGAYLAGAVPHRVSGGASVGAPGLSARQMLETPLKAYVCSGNRSAERPGVDASAPSRMVVAMTTHLPESRAACAWYCPSARCQSAGTRERGRALVSWPAQSFRRAAG